MDGNDVACVCDGPHLLKNWKTALMTYDCFLLSDDIVKVHQLPSNKVKFSHILALAKFQEDKKWVYAPVNVPIPARYEPALVLRVRPVAPR